MDWFVRTLAALWLGASLTLVCGGRVFAHSHCETERSPNERQFHCIEFGSVRFRIPDDYLIVRLHPDPETGRMDRIDTMSEKWRGNIGTFFFVAELPDLAAIDRTRQRGYPSPSQVTAWVTRKEDSVPPYVERNGGRWVFSERVIEALIVRGFKREFDEPRPSILTKGPISFRIVRGPAGIIEIIRDGEGMFICLLAYAEGVVVGIHLFKDRDRACIEGRRVVEKLRSFEY